MTYDNNFLYYLTTSHIHKPKEQVRYMWMTLYNRFVHVPNYVTDTNTHLHIHYKQTHTHTYTNTQTPIIIILWDTAIHINSDYYTHTNQPRPNQHSNDSFGD